MLNRARKAHLVSVHQVSYSDSYSSSQLLLAYLIGQMTRDREKSRMNLMTMEVGYHRHMEVDAEERGIAATERAQATRKRIDHAEASVCCTLSDGSPQKGL